MKTPIALTPKGLIIALATMDMKAMASTALVIISLLRRIQFFMVINRPMTSP